MSFTGPVGRNNKPASSGPALLAGAIASALVGWPFALWSAHRARRRLRAYGPPAVLALRTARGRQI